MLSNAQNAIYINLNMDEMLPCYGTSAAEQDEECELVVGGGGDTDGYRTLEADDDFSVGGYRTLESEGGTVNGILGYHMLERDNDASTGGYWVLERGDDSRIASADVAVLDVAGQATVQVEQHEMARGKRKGEKEGGQHST